MLYWHRYAGWKTHFIVMTQRMQVLYVRAARLEDLPSLRPEHLPDDVVHRLRGVLDSAVFGRWREEHLAPLGW